MGLPSEIFDNLIQIAIQSYQEKQIDLSKLIQFGIQIDDNEQTYNFDEEYFITLLERNIITFNEFFKTCCDLEYACILSQKPHFFQKLVQRSILTESDIQNIFQRAYTTHPELKQLFTDLT